MRRELLLAAVFLFGGASMATGEKVTIVRDEWGVPHVFAETEAGGCYGLGWAQAEDRLEQLLRNYRWAAGTMSEAFGEEHVEHDWQCRLVGHQEVSKRRYAEVPEDVRAAIDALQQGVRDYMAAHPDEVPDWAPELEPWMVPALGRAIIFGWPLGRAHAELNRREEVDLPFSSNQWAVRPERTADGHTIMCIDPHIPWDGPFRFYEFRVHAGELDLCGFGPVGSPTLGLGHNARLGWACTTGGPDTTDVYVEQCDPDNPRRYRYDNEWREMTVREVTIAVKDADPVVREVESTHHGPVFLREGNRAYAVACPYFEEVGLVTQLYRMGQAKSLEEFREAIGLLQLMEQNTMMADVEGNISYARTGRVPMRPEGFDFALPVPGNTSKTEWLGLHPPEDLVRLHNPERGYMQNNNCGPDVMLVDSPLKPEDYPSYIYNERPGAAHSRSRRGVELLEAADKLTVEQAIDIALDVHAEGVDEWKAALRQAREGITAEQIEAIPGAGDALEAFMAWDGYLTIDAAAGPFYRALREASRSLEPPVDNDAIMRGERLSEDQVNLVRQAVVNALGELMEAYGKTVLPWGDIHRIRRGENSWPAAGGDGGGGSTLRAIGTSRDEADGILYGNSGQSWTQLVVFEPGNVRSYSATPYGQSDRPDSPHYTDQAERLYSKLELKDTYFMPDSLKGHEESTTELEWEG